MENSLRLSEITQERKNKATFNKDMEVDSDMRSISNLGEQILRNYQPDFQDQKREMKYDQFKFVVQEHDIEKQLCSKDDSKIKLM